MKTLFGTDGIRGLANDSLSVNSTINLAQSSAIILGYKFKYCNSKCNFTNLNNCLKLFRFYKKPKALIARDTRISGYCLNSSFIAGLTSSGVDVYDLGIFPTPGLAYLTSILNMDFGVMISASHNHAYDNGIKLFSNKGSKLTDNDEHAIEKVFYSTYRYNPIGKNLGKIFYISGSKATYINYLLKSGTRPFNFRGLRIVLDCANGASIVCSKDLFQKTGATVKVIGDNANGININKCSGTTNLSNLKKHVLLNKYDLGIAYDGDADRCLAVDNLGRKVDGDQIMTILALGLKSEKKLKYNTLVATSMSNLGMENTLFKENIFVKYTQVGDKNVLKFMKQKGYSLGGEQSGHIIFSQYSNIGDGLLTSLHLIDQIIQSKQSLSKLADKMKKFPQILKNIPVTIEEKKSIHENSKIQILIAKSKKQLGKKGKILLRPSGTESLLRLLIESENLILIRKICKKITILIQENRENQ